MVKFEQVGTYQNFFSNERNAKILAMRMQGFTLQEVGTEFGLTRESIRQIVMRGQQATEVKNSAEDISIDSTINDVKFFLSTRIFNCFVKEGWADEKIKDVARFPDKTLLLIPNLGKKAVKDWREVVHRVRRGNLPNGYG